MTVKVESYQLSNLDAAENIFFARELEHIKSKTYDVVYPDLKAEKFIPVSTEVDEGAESWTYTQYDHVGLAKLIASYADDLPRADVKGQQFSQTIKGIGTSFGYNMQEIRAAKKAGKPLSQMRANAAREVHARKRDDLAFSGDADANLIGFSNNANVSEITAGAKTGGGTTWLGASATGAEMLADLNAIYAKTLNVTNGIEVIDTILLPVAQYVKASQTRIDATLTTTVLEQFKKTHPDVSVEMWYKLDNAASDDTDLAIGYRKSADKVVMEIPMELQMHAPQPKNLEFMVPCESRFGGVVFFYPLSAVYMKGL